MSKNQSSKEVLPEKPGDIGSSYMSVGCILRHVSIEQCQAMSKEPFRASSLPDYFRMDKLCSTDSMQAKDTALWEEVPGAEGFEQEKIHDHLTGWQRRRISVDLHGWIKESLLPHVHGPMSPLYQRWRNIYTGELKYGAKPNDPLSFEIVKGVLTHVLIDKEIVKSADELSVHWKLLIESYGRMAIELQLRDMDFFQPFYRLIKKRPVPIPIILNRLSSAVICAEAETVFPGQQFANRQEMQTALYAQHVMVNSEPVMRDIILLENLTCEALLVMAKEKQVPIDPDGSRLELVEKLTEKILGST